MINIIDFYQQDVKALNKKSQKPKRIALFGFWLSLLVSISLINY